MTRSAPLPEATTEVAALRRRIAESAPRRGWRPPDDAAVRFATLPLSARTLEGLAAGGFETLKPIQRAAIPHALVDRDVLGAARTGSGKTLAFLVPAVEALYRERWAREDGLGALVISPTRELALQIFEVLRVVGARHDFSAGLITGGRTRDWAAEQARVVRASFLVATPGRALQHLEETPGLDAGRLQALVVDEADRVVDLGFAPQLDAIATYLPAAGARRTWLFSATLAGVGGGGCSGARLARLRALADAATVEFVVARDDRAALLRARAPPAAREAVTRAGGPAPTPATLAQRLVVCALEDKLDLLYAFVRAHVGSKTLVFVSTCAQARFLLEALRGARPGTPLAALHGKQSQAKRVAVFRAFAARSGGAVLVATDVAARGLDVPDIDWVVQLDAPEDADAYVHRVGRAARNGRRGDALLVVAPHERARVDAALAAAGLRVDVVRADPRRARSVRAHVDALVASRPNARAAAVRCFRAYVRAAALHAGADAAALPLAAYARSLGLPTAPRVALPRSPAAAADARERAHVAKNVNRKLARLKAQISAAKKRAPAATPARAGGGDDDGPLVRALAGASAAAAAALARAAAPLPPPRARVKRLRLDAAGTSTTAAPPTRFDDDGRAVAPAATTFAAAAPRAGPALAHASDDFVARVRERLRLTAAGDRAAERNRRQEKRRRD